MIGPIGSFQTLPPAGAPADFFIAFSGDAETGSDFRSFSAIRAENPLLFIHLGDLHYENISVNDQDVFHQAYDKVLKSPRQATLYREIPTIYVWDDHDYGPNNSDGTSITKPAAAAAYRSRVPHYPLEESTSIYHSFDVGRVRFIVTDQRSAASPNSDTDNSSKTMLGTAQKTWFKNLLSNSPGMLIVWVCPRWFGKGAVAGGDSWGGFTTERTELADHIKANCLGRVIILAADLHTLAIDDGTNHDFATGGGCPIPIFQSAALDQSVFIGTDATYSEGGQFTNRGQYGTMEVSDPDTGAIRVTWHGCDSFSNELATLTFHVMVEAPQPFYSATKTLNGDWFTAQGPAAIYFADIDKTYVAWQMVGNGGFKGIQIASYDHSTKTWSERFKVGDFNLANDNHGSAAVIRDAEGYVYVFFGAHDSTQPWCISNSPSDISSWTPQAPLGTALTYPHACLVGSTIHVFWRNDAVSTRRTLVRSSTTPSGGSATFASLTAIVDFDTDSRVYMGEAIPVGTDIHIVATRANAADTERKGIYYFVYDTVTGAVKNHDGSVSTASGSLPVSLTTANASYRLFDHGTGRGDIPSLCFATNGDPHILFADNGGSGTTFTLKHITRVSGVWSSPVSVSVLGVTFPGIGYVATYSCVAGASNYVEAWYIDSSGNKIRRVRTPIGGWGPGYTISTAGSDRLDDNQSVRNAKADFRVIYGEISTSFVDSSAVFASRFGWGDNGPIATAIPMAAQDASFANVSLLLAFNQRDGSVRTVNDSDTCLIPTFNGNAQIDTSQSKFGIASLLLDGTGDYITFANNVLFSVSNGDFTVEMFVRRNGTKLQALASKRPAAGVSEWSFYVDASNRLIMQAFDSSVAVVNVTGTGTLSSTSIWYHVALSRQGNTWYMFLDGNLEGSAVQSGTPASNTQLLHIGRDPSNTGRDFDGWIDEFRFTSGVGRYNATFTAPSIPFPRR